MDSHESFLGGSGLACVLHDNRARPKAENEARKVKNLRDYLSDVPTLSPTQVQSQDEEVRQAQARPSSATSLTGKRRFGTNLNSSVLNVGNLAPSGEEFPVFAKTSSSFLQSPKHCLTSDEHPLNIRAQLKEILSHPHGQSVTSYQQRSQER